MIIQCPYCLTRFRLPESRLVGANPMLKCSRCRHIFPAERTQRAAGEERAGRQRAAAVPPPRPPEGRDLDLVFDEAEWDGGRGELAMPRDEEEFSLGTGGEPGRSRGDASTAREPRLLSEADPTRRTSADTAYSFDEAALDSDKAVDEDEEEQDEEAPEVEEDDDEENDEDDDHDEEERAAREDEVKRGGAWGLSLLMFFAVVVAGYFLLARQLLSDRAFAEEFVERLPMVGSSLAADRLLFRKVALADIEGSFVRVKQGRDVFVISGTALNTASRPLRNIRIESTLLDGGAQPLQQETITLGGMDARRLLQGLSLREVEMLGKVEPSRKFTLEPGETTTFTIVFTNPPTGAVDFTARVESAQR